MTLREVLTCRQEYSPVEVVTSQYWLPVLASRNPPGSERLVANCSAPSAFHT